MTRSRMLMLVIIAAAVCVASAGVGAGAEWHVHPGESIQDAIGDAEHGDTIYVHAGECGCGDGAGVRTADTKILM